MLKAIQEFFDARISDSPADDTRDEPGLHRLQLATAALLIEVSRADFQESDAERAAILAAIGRKFDLDGDETAELVRLANLEVERSTDLYQFTRLVNTAFSPARKRRLVELLWQVAYADGRVNHHQEHIVRRVAELLHVPHREFIRAKLAVTEAEAGQVAPADLLAPQARLMEIVVPATDAAATSAFYRAMVGLESAGETGGGHLRLRTPGHDEAPVIRITGAAGGATELIFGVTDRAAVDRVAATAREAGQLLWEPDSDDDGGYACALRDPDGRTVVIRCGRD